MMLSKSVEYNWHAPDLSRLEAVLARGDRRLNQVLLEAYARGCHMDGWNEFFRPDLWQEAFAAAGLTVRQFAGWAPACGAPLPWSHIDCGVREAWLWRENEKAARAELTEPCRESGAFVYGSGKCSGCGVCRDGWQPELLPPAPPVKRAAAPAAPAVWAENGGEAVRYRYRCCLQVDGACAWLSQLELMTAFAKTLRRAALPVACSQGFNPHPLIAWGPAHPVGLFSTGEYADLLLLQPVDDLPQRFQTAAPPGLTMLAAEPIELTAPAAMAWFDQAAYRIELDAAAVAADFATLDAQIAALLAAEQVEIRRETPKGVKTVDIRPALRELSRQGNAVVYSTRLDSGAAAKPGEILTRLLPDYDGPVRFIRVALTHAALK